LDWWLIKDTPEEAGFPPFDTCDASSGQMGVNLSAKELLGKVFGSSLMLLFAGVALTAGVLRNGIMQWYAVFAHEMPRMGAEFYTVHWGFLLCMFGIVGSFVGGLISDKVYQSRRGPPAALFCGFMFVMTIVMTAWLFSSPIVVAWAALLIVLAVTGVHSLMSGTAAPDFGGRKAAATCSGLIDGCVYLGSGLQSIAIGYLAGLSWIWWPIFLAPFALIGMFVALRFWNELPPATRKYIAEVELKQATELSSPREAAKA
jgi:OPA family glycerol-3-phosphate transporter-like MFS transporter